MYSCAMLVTRGSSAKEGGNNNNNVNPPVQNLRRQKSEKDADAMQRKIKNNLRKLVSSKQKREDA